MPAERHLSGTTALITGASRGFGRAIAAALCRDGAEVVGVARDRAGLDQARGELGTSFTAVAADAADPVVAGELISAYRPRTLVLCAGASPLSRPLQQHTWQSFSRNWDVDVQHVFGWVREALLLPLDPGSAVITFSSGAAVAGSPLSGGYAGAKATIRFLTAYAADESQRAGLGITFTSVLPQLTPATGLGAAAVAAYAARSGLDVPAFLAQRGPALTAEQVGDAVAKLAAGPADVTAAAPAGLGGAPAYLLTAAGPSPLE
jgi:NAD(P)-dependent dehydrogenase (short-subunit alcohol dehydrogenase family)